MENWSESLGFMHFYVKHYEDAAVHFRKAANFLAGDNLLDQSDFCVEKNAECLIHIGEYEEASKQYELIARSCVCSNLRRFNARDYLLKALICYFGVPETKPYSIPLGPSSSVAASYGASGSVSGAAQGGVVSIGPPGTVAANTVLSPLSASITGAPAVSGGIGGVVNQGDSGNNAVSADQNFADDATVSSLGNASATAKPSRPSSAPNARYQAPALYQSKYDKMYTLCDSYDQVDFMWRMSKEKLFMRNILLSRIEGDKHEFVDHLYYWQNIRPLEAWCLQLLKIPLDEMQAELDRLAKIKADEESAVKKAKDRAKAIEEGRSVVSDAKDTNSVAGTDKHGDRKSDTGGRASINKSDGGGAGGGGRASVNKDNRGSIRAESERSADTGSVGRPSNAGKAK